MGKFWKYGIALLLGVWFVICNQYASVPMAYNTSATYNYRMLTKYSRMSQTRLTFSHGKGSRQTHHTIKRWLKENEAFLLLTPLSLSFRTVPVISRSRFFTSQESFLSSTHRLTSLRGPPTTSSGL